MDIRKFLIVLVVVGACYTLCGCEDSTKPEEAAKYMSLSVGDIRQFFSTKSGSIITRKVVGKVKRVDNLEVFAIEQSGRDFQGPWVDTSYHFIKDGYCWATRLDTLPEEYMIEGNPYNEQRLAKVYPKDGDRWMRYDTEIDSLKSYFYADYVEEYATKVKIFSDVFAVNVEGEELPNEFKAFYAKNYGLIGSRYTDEGKLFEFQLRYLKVGGKEVGEYIPVELGKASKGRKPKGDRNKYYGLGMF